MFACNKGHTEVVQLFLKHSDPSIDPNVKDDYGITGLMFACLEGHTDGVQLLPDHPDKNIELNVRDNSGETALNVGLLSRKQRCCPIVS